MSKTFHKNSSRAIESSLSLMRQSSIRLAFIGSILILLIGIIVVYTPHTLFAETTADEAAADEKQEKLDKLQNKIDSARGEHNGLQEKINLYEENLESKQQEKTTLNNQLEVLDQNISLTETEIDQTMNEIDTLDLEIQQVKIQINDTQKDITSAKKDIGALITDLYNYDQQTYLEVALANTTLSEYSSQVQYTEEINNAFKESLDELKASKRELQQQKQVVTDKKTDQVQKQGELEIRKDSLGGEITYKNILLESVKDDEEKFQQLLDEIKDEQAGINSELSRLEKTARQTLNDLNSLKGTDQPVDGITGPDKDFVMPTDFTPDWPLTGIITTRFKDPAYIFRSVFEHDAIDIASPQGTPIKAADSGVVSVVRFDGSSNYGYVSIVHAGNFSTVYGHVSAVYVSSEETVQKGQTIALSGGYPGTAGAGPFTTGPHLHFGVRLNGIPVDPLLYLP